MSAYISSELRGSSAAPIGPPAIRTPPSLERRVPEPSNRGFGLVSSPEDADSEESTRSAADALLLLPCTTPLACSCPSCLVRVIKLEDDGEGMTGRETSPVRVLS